MKARDGSGRVAAVSLIMTGNWETPAVIVGVVLLNAVIGFVQESRAGASVEALKKLLATSAAIRRGGVVRSVDSA